MKKNYFLLLIFFIGFNLTGYSQWINSISFSPPYPTTNDSVTFYVDCSFSSGSCEPYVSSVFVSGNEVFANALHCLGMLTVICPYTDTFTVAPLAAGNYVFRMQLNEGGGPAPCTPGIAPGPVDSLDFSVIQATGIPPVRGEAACQIYTDASKGTLTVIYPAAVSTDPARLRIYSYDGRAVFSAPVSETVSVFSPRLPSGTYVASLETGDARYQKKIIVFN